MAYSRRVTRRLLALALFAALWYAVFRSAPGAAFFAASMFLAIEAGNWWERRHATARRTQSDENAPDRRGREKPSR